MGDGFYIVGIVLVVGALVLSFVGLREHGFPSTRGPYAGVLVVLAALVVTTCAFAVALAREEAEHRTEEQEAHAEEQAEAEGEGATEGPAPSDAGEEPAPGGGAEEGEEPAGGAGGAETIEVTSPADGSLKFDQESLSADAGAVELSYTNSSPVPHNVAIEADGETVAEGEVVSGGETSRAATELEPGKYVFFCSVPGHREAGMEGELTVK